MGVLCIIKVPESRAKMTDLLLLLDLSQALGTSLLLALALLQEGLGHENMVVSRGTIFIEIST